MKCKRILSMLLTLCMVMSLFAGTTVTASAADGATTLYVNGVDMLDDSSTAPTGVSYDKSTNTLTLENAELSTPYSGNVNYAMHAAVIYSTGNLTIDLVGSSTITYSTSGEATYLAGIVNTGGNLKFTGSGSLTIKNGIDAAGNNKRYYGICSYGALTVDNPTITIDAEKTMTCAEECGVLVAGAFAIEKGTVTIRTWNTTTSSNIALCVASGTNSTLGSGAKLIAEAGNSGDDTKSYGIMLQNSSLKLKAGASLRASGGKQALRTSTGTISAASTDLTLSATGSTTHKAATEQLKTISSDSKTLTSSRYKTLEVTASNTPAQYATAVLKLNGYTAGAAFDQATITTTSSTGFKSISLAGFMDDPNGKFDPKGTFSGTKAYYVSLKMPRGAGYKLQESDGKPVGVTLEGATPQPLKTNKDFLIFKMNSKPAAAAPTFTDGFGNTVENAATYEKGKTINEKGYTFAGWFNGETELTSADAAVAGTTYTAKWTKNGKTVRTAVLDLTAISESNTFGATLTGGVYTNAAEGWNWDTATKTLTLSGCNFNIVDTTGTSGFMAIKLPAKSTINLASETENIVVSSSTKQSGAIGAATSLTIKGDGTLGITSSFTGIMAGGNIAINSPITVKSTSNEEYAMAIAIESENEADTITIADTLEITKPVEGKIHSRGKTILDSNGGVAKEVVISAKGGSTETPTFNDGLGKADCTFNTYAKGAKNDKGYTFAGWFGDDGKELTSAAGATAGKTYTAKWTKNGKTVRTAVLDLTQISESNTLGATKSGDIYTNGNEGWSWDATTKTLTLSGATFDVNKQSTEPNIEGSGAILLPANASVTTKKGTENTVHNGSTIGTALGTYIGSGIVSKGAFTIKGDGELSVTAGAFGVFAVGDVSIEAPISIVCTETEGNVAAVVTDKDHSITIAPSLCIKTPTKGKVASSGVARYIAEQDGQKPARNVVIGAASNSYYYYGGGSTSSKTPNKTPKTADAGISLYAGMAVASLLGSGVVFSRKRKDF